MNNLDKQYQNLLQDILDNGIQKGDRTGTGTISVFGRQIRHKMSEGFPLLTTKKMAWKTMVTELLWFLRGDTNIKYLVDNDCHIWDGDAYKNYVTNVMQNHKGVHPNSKEAFIAKIKHEDDYAKQWGDLGPIYGNQWRDWGGKTHTELSTTKGKDGFYGYITNHIPGIDQIKNLIEQLETNPDSRRLMVNAWNVGALESMVLPPCHYGFQVYTRELTIKERLELFDEFFDVTLNSENMSEAEIHEALSESNIPTRAISLMWNQRSVDTFLGLPFNIASYGLLLEIIAKEVNMIPDELIGNLGDCHIYKNQIDGVKEQLTREPFDLPKIKITERNWYQHEAVKERLGRKTFNDKILSYRPDCFELIGYQSHSKIKIPLSN